MPVHNGQMLMYGAVMSGDLRLAQDIGEKMKGFSATYGPTYMTDGESCLVWVCPHLFVYDQKSLKNQMGCMHY